LEHTLKGEVIGACEAKPKKVPVREPSVTGPEDTREVLKYAAEA